MSSVATLPISRLINVQVSLQAQAAQAQNINSMLVVGSSTVIDTVTRIRTYTSIAQVAADFGTSAPEYLAAVLWFSQNPQPTSLLIGRWVKTASAGQLLGATLPAASQLPSFWTSITTGAMNITIDGGSVEHLTGLNFSAVGNMNAVASVIQGGLTGATIVWNAIYQRFVVTSNTTGAASSVSFATAPGSGTDISVLTGLSQLASGSFQAPGLVAESAITCVTLMDSLFGQLWFGLTVLGIVDADALAIGPYIEATSANIHFYGVTSQEAATLTPGDTTSLAYLLQQLGLNRTCVQYSSSNSAAVVSLLGRILTTNYQASGSAITLMYKQEPGITPENLSITQVNALEAKNCNVYVAYNNATAIIEMGQCCSGQYIDSVIGVLVFAILAQTAVFNVLFTTPTKVPQTDPGMATITTAIANVAQQFVNNGLFAPGTWTSAGFGALNTGDTVSKGYYIWCPSMASQTQAQRSARIGVPIQIAVKLAGAVQEVDVLVSVNS